MIMFNKLWLCIFTTFLKDAKRFMCIYTNGWLYIFAVCLKSAKRLIIIYLFTWYLFLELKNSLKWVLREWGFTFCLRFRRHFFRHTDFLRFKILKKIFFFKFRFWVSWKKYRLVPCIPILRRLFLLKVQKRCVCVNMLFLVLMLLKIYVLIWKKGISR